MDLSLELLRRLTVRGGVGWVHEVRRPGSGHLSLTERATICNLGAELGATASVFPSDQITRDFLQARGREKDWQELLPDRDASDETIEVDLSRVEPLTAQPFSPDNVVPLKDLVGLRVDQVCIGSCSNSSYEVLRAVACIVKGKTIAPHLNLLVNPGSRQVVGNLAADGSLGALIAAGARILEAACGPCIGMGGAPPDQGISFRSYNRNFKGRSGTANARVFLVNPLAGALLALQGEVVDPLRYPLRLPSSAPVPPFPGSGPDDPTAAPKNGRFGDHPRPQHPADPPKETDPGYLSAAVLIKLGDHVTTDDILPGGSEVLPFAPTSRRFPATPFPGWMPVLPNGRWRPRRGHHRR